MRPGSNEKMQLLPTKDESKGEEYFDLFFLSLSNLPLQKQKPADIAAWRRQSAEVLSTTKQSRTEQEQGMYHIAN